MDLFEGNVPFLVFLSAHPILPLESCLPMKCTYWILEANICEYGHQEPPSGSECQHLVETFLRIFPAKGWNWGVLREQLFSTKLILFDQPSTPSLVEILRFRGSRVNLSEERCQNKYWYLILTERSKHKYIHKSFLGGTTRIQLLKMHFKVFSFRIETGRYSESTF